MLIKRKSSHKELGSTEIIDRLLGEVIDFVADLKVDKELETVLNGYSIFRKQWIIDSWKVEIIFYKKVDLTGADIVYINKNSNFNRISSLRRIEDGFSSTNADILIEFFSDFEKIKSYKELSSLLPSNETKVNKSKI